MTFTIGALLLGLALLIVVVLFLAQPFFDASFRDEDMDEIDEREALTLQKEALLAQIRQLEFDHELGNVPTGAFEEERQALVLQTAEIMRQLDVSVVSADADTIADIEAAVSKLRRSRPRATAAHFCTHCGQPLDADDKFCAACGQPVKVVAATS